MDEFKCLITLLVHVLFIYIIRRIDLCKYRLMYVSTYVSIDLCEHLFVYDLLLSCASASTTYSGNKV
jgi:hypothetical protein